MKHDLFVTDVWEFDFPYHHQIKKQVFENLQKFIAFSKGFIYALNTNNLFIHYLIFGLDQLLKLISQDI